MYEARSLVVDFSEVDRLGANPGFCNMIPIVTIMGEI